jgi:hypothetical protein
MCRMAHRNQGRGSHLNAPPSGSSRFPSLVPDKHLNLLCFGTAARRAGRAGLPIRPIRRPKCSRRGWNYGCPTRAATPLAYTAMLAAGLDGLDRGCELGPPLEEIEHGFGGSGHSVTKPLPASLGEALVALEDDDVLTFALGPDCPSDRAYAKCRCVAPRRAEQGRRPRRAARRSSTDPRPPTGSGPVAIGLLRRNEVGQRPASGRLCPQRHERSRRLDQVPAQTR